MNYLENAKNLLEFPEGLSGNIIERNISIAQVHALIAIAEELARMNDQAEAADEAAFNQALWDVEK